MEGADTKAQESEGEIQTISEFLERVDLSKLENLVLNRVLS